MHCLNHICVQPMLSHSFNEWNHTTSRVYAALCGSHFYVLIYKTLSSCLCTEFSFIQQLSILVSAQIDEESRNNWCQFQNFRCCCDFDALRTGRGYLLGMWSVPGVAGYTPPWPQCTCLSQTQQALAVSFCVREF